MSLDEHAPDPPPGVSAPSDDRLQVDPTRITFAPPLGLADLEALGRQITETLAPLRASMQGIAEVARLVTDVIWQPPPIVVEVHLADRSRHQLALGPPIAADWVAAVEYLALAGAKGELLETVDKEVFISAFMITSVTLVRSPSDE